MAAATTQGSSPESTVPPVRSPSGGKHLPTLVGVLVAVLAVGVYFAFFLKPPPPSAAGAVARLSSIEGSVRVKPVGTEAWTNAQPSRSLDTGDVVQTDHRSGAEITFFTGNVVQVRPDSVVLISEGQAAVAEEATAWHVQSGQVNFELKRETDIVTSTARTRAAANSTGNVNVTDDGGTGVKIFRGSAQVSTKQGQTVALTENQAVIVDPQGQAGPKIVLPPTPAPIAPPGRAELPYVAPPQKTTELQWEAVHGAQTYRVIIDYNVHQANLLLSAALDRPGIAATAQELQGLDPGSYFWRVAGVSKEGIEGEFSKISLFSVVKAASPEPPGRGPALTVGVVAVLDGILEVKGRTEPGVSVTVDGHEVNVLPDGSFGEFVKRGGTEFVVVRAVDAGGQFTEQKKPVAAH